LPPLPLGAPASLRTQVPRGLHGLAHVPVDDIDPVGAGRAVGAGLALR
jgi:hypothetical protein